MSTYSIVTNRDRQCLACRLTSGFGLIGAGLYVSYQSKKFNRKPGVILMYSVAGALCLLGTARIFDLPPFRQKI